MSEELEGYSKQELLQQLDELSEELDSNIDKAENLYEQFDTENDLFRMTAGNDDGNEDRPETFDADGDDVQGVERGEELIRLGNYLEAAPEYHKDIEELREKIDELEVLDTIVEEIDDLKDALENLRPEDLDTGSN
ncbi:hypothetical protein MMO39_13100 [Acinetobacter modestus]|uniref:hypothetical protein n=1 Tax=Acinetobacter modestus TaxID=1776740 RepID=UPI001F4B0208|nr:hypothetical protein [Acinetobacter modestus]MCH7388226.1 hypothetical protein [Acinetobacter modestus]